LAAGLGSLRALPITAEINRRSAPHRQADHAVDLLAVADPAQVLAPGRLLSVADEILPGDVVVMSELVLSAFAPASIAELDGERDSFSQLPTHSKPLRCGGESETYGSRRRLADWFGSGNGESYATRRRRDKIRRPIVDT
jgi:hypothetical protein